MRELKNSGVEWIGKIPSGWKVQRAKTYFKQTNTRGNQNLVLLAATQKYGMFPQDMIEGVVKVKEDTDLQNFKTVHKGDFVISLRSFQGGFEMSDYEGVCSPAYQTFHAVKDINNNYFRYFFKSSCFIDAINSLTVGIREGKNIRYEDFANSLIIFPPLAEQIAISSYLDDKCAKIDAIIARHELIIAKLKEYRASLITETVTRGLNPDSELKDSGVKLKYLCTCNDENLAESTSDDYEFDYIDIGSVTQSEGVSMLQRMSFKNAPSRARRIVRNGDVIISTVRTYLKAVARINFSNVPQIASTGFAVLRAKNINPNYLYYAVISDSFVSSVEAKSVGISYPAINSSELMNLKIPVPPLDQQAAIASYLDDKCARIDDNIAKRELIIRKLTDYKKSLIYEAVTGKKEYNHHENDME